MYDEYNATMIHHDTKEALDIIEQELEKADFAFFEVKSDGIHAEELILYTIEFTENEVRRQSFSLPLALLFLSNDQRAIALMRNLKQNVVEMLKPYGD